MTMYQRIQRYPTYRLARWYCFTCGFAVTPLRPWSKQRLFSGNTFQTWFPREDHLCKWFCTPQPYGIAIVPGEVSGNLVILDFDEVSVYQVWLSLIPGAVDFPIVRSARGVHVYTRLKDMVSNGQGQFEGLIFGDIIAHGNITAPPSIHPSGHVYEWIGDPRQIPQCASLAEIGIERVAPPREIWVRKPLSPKHLLAADDIRWPQAYVRAAIADEQQELLRAVQGARNHQLYRSALKLSKYLDLVSESLIVSELARTAIQIGLQQDEIGATIRSGFRHGIEHGVLQRR